MKITIKADTTLKRISVWNGIFDLTKKELLVLSALIDSTVDSNIVSASTKKDAAKIVGITDFNTLNNYVKRLKDKKALLYNNKKYSLHPLLQKENSNVQIVITT
tara:strand:+ start:766 stop:1077 length:312 start_codon:yes stop_codon:yes gene_type:complete